jgi:hypothetical protein
VRESALRFDPSFSRLRFCSSPAHVRLSPALSEFIFLLRNPALPTWNQKHKAGAVT